MDNKDLPIKVMCKILYNRMGYCAHYELRLRNKSYINSFKSHDVSDIDMYGYLFNADLSLNKIGAECKSGETNALDELYKFMGISQSYGLNKAYLLKTKIHQNARQIALDNSVVTLTHTELRKLLLGFGLNIDKAIEIELAKYLKRYKYLQGFKFKNEKLIEYILLDFWNKENWKNIHNLLHVAKLQISQEALFVDITNQDKYVYYYVAELFAYTILRTVHDAIVMSYSDFEGAIGNCFYGGAEALNEKRRIHDAVNIATQEDKKFEPEWQLDLVNICTRLSQSTLAASKVPNLLQDLYENIFFDHSVKIDAKKLKQYPDLTRKFVQDIMQFLTKYCELDPRIFEDFMKE